MQRSCLLSVCCETARRFIFFTGVRLAIGHVMAVMTYMTHSPFRLCPVRSLNG